MSRTGFTLKEDLSTEIVVPAKLSCQHPLCNLLIKKDIICAEKNKSLTNAKPKHDMVDIYSSDLRLEINRRNELKKSP